MSESGSDTRSGIGARLRAGRERMGLTQLQAAEKLHVDAKVVESLETENFEALGATVFVRGHLRRYAELIGEQAAQLLEMQGGANKPVLPDLTRLPKAAPPTSTSRMAVPALLVLIGFVLIGVVWWILQSLRSSSDKPSESSVAHEVPLEPELGTLTSEVDPGTGEPVTGDSSGAATRAAGTPGSTAPRAGTPAASNTSNAANAPGAAAPGAATPATPPTRSRAMEVTLKFAADSWVEIYDAKGERLFYDIGSAESQRTISGTPPFRVTFGNAPGVSLDVNGKPAAVPANAVTDDQAQFVINRSGRIVRARPQAPASAPN
jgi:cytoskeleton protein RodZ